VPPLSATAIEMERNRGVNDPAFGLATRPRPFPGVVHATVPGVHDMSLSGVRAGAVLSVQNRARNLWQKGMARGHGCGRNISNERSSSSRSLVYARNGAAMSRPRRSTRTICTVSASTRYAIT